MRVPQPTDQAVLAALVEPLEILWHAKLLESVHVKIKLPDLSGFLDGVPVCSADLVLWRYAEEHCERAALCLVGSARLLGKSDAQEEDATCAHVLSCLL